MSKSAIRAFIDQFITTNGSQGIKGSDVNNVLRQIVDDYPTAEQVVSGMKGEAITTTVPTPYNSTTYPNGLFEKYEVRTAGTYANFKDASNASIDVSATDLDKKTVQLWVQNGVAKKIITALPTVTAETTFNPADNVNASTMKALNDFFLTQTDLSVISPTLTANYLSKTGALVSNSGFRTSDYIAVTSNTTIRRIAQSYDVGASSASPIAFYDADKNFISAFTTGTVLATQDFKVSNFGSNIAFARVCGNASLVIMTGSEGDPKLKNTFLPTIVSNVFVPTNESSAPTMKSLNDFYFIVVDVLNAVNTTYSQFLIEKTTGAITANENFISSDYIAVTSNSVIRRISQGYNVGGSSAAPIAFYDASKNFIAAFSSGVVSATQDFKISDYGSNIAFVRVSGSKAANLQVFSVNGTKSVLRPALMPDLDLGYKDGFSIDFRAIASFANQPYFGGNSGYSIFKPKTTGTPPRFYLMPNGDVGTGVSAKLELFGTDYEADSANYTGLNILVYKNEIHFGCNKNGTAGNSKQIYGAKYTGSIINSSSARLEFQINDSVDAYGTSYNFKNKINLATLTSLPAGVAGDIIFHGGKHKGFNGTAWMDLY